MKKKECTKKLLTAILCAAVALSAVPFSTMAAPAGNAAKEKLRKAEESDFEIDANGVLTNYKGSGGAVEIPAGVKSIGNSAFIGREGVTSVMIPDSVTSIEDLAFQWCPDLKSITIPGSVKTVGRQAFYRCDRLVSATFQEGVESIGDNVFSCCSALTSVTIPKSVTRIGKTLFAGCHEYGCSQYITLYGDENSVAQTYAKTADTFGGPLPFVATCSDGKQRTVISTLYVSVDGASSYVYTGKAITPPIAISFRGKKLVNGQDYTIGEYKNNVNPGFASVTVTGIGDYTGTADASFKIKPAAPSAVKQTKRTATSISLSWNKVVGATKYTVERAPYGSKTFKQIAEVKTTSYTDTKLAAGKSYQYRIYALWSVFKSTSSKIVTASTSKIKLAAPGSAGQTARTTTSIKIGWKKVAGATSYVVERAPYGSKKFKKIATVKTTSYTNKKLAAGQFYQYRVRAYQSGTGGAYSKIVTANTSLSAPSISKVTSPKKKQAVVTWKKTKGATGYQVYRATSKKGKYKKVATVKSTKYIDKKVSRKKTYYYKVRAYKKVKSKTIYSGYSGVKGKKVK